MRAHLALALALALAALLTLGGCKTRYVPALEYGETLFNSTDLSTSDFNHFSCATCHATTAEPPAGVLFSGYTMRDAAFRESWWGGYERTLLDSVNFCLVFFMRGDAFAPDDPRGRALYEYLASLSPTRPSPALPLTIPPAVHDAPPRGDAARGREVYEGACRECHGTWPGCRHRLGDSSNLCEVFAEYPTLFPKHEPAAIVAEKVRHGQFFGIGGNMPVFSMEALSDEDLGALLALFEL